MQAFLSIIGGVVFGGLMALVVVIIIICSESKNKTPLN